MTDTETKLADALRELLDSHDHAVECDYADQRAADEREAAARVAARESLAAHDSARAQPASVADGETFEVRKGKDGQFGIYMSDLNVRVATFTACTAATRDRISALLAAAPQPRAKGDAE